jgi:mannose-6-phosphate isomerase-like protein (cupin superfamily)
MNLKSALGLGFMLCATGWGAAMAQTGGAPPAAAAQKSLPPAIAAVAPETTHVAPFQANVLQAARSNDAYRRVLFTGAKTQLVLMTIPTGGDIGFETHPHVEQLLFIVSGQGKAILDGAETVVGPGDVVVVTPGTHHDIVNTGAEPLRIYTVYAPPNHIDGRVHRTKADAEADTADEAFGQAVR